MSCLPGMPCYNSPVVKIVYPPGCDPTPVPVISSDQVHYDGPNLPCTGVQNGDCLNVALEKIDAKICSEELVASIIQTIENNDVLKAYFCQLVSDCIPTTTTTTTQVTGNAYSVTGGTTPEEVCNGLGTSITIYTLPGDIIDDGVQAFTDINCTIPYTNSAFIYLNVVYSTDNSGIISFLSVGCIPFTTTTTSSSSTSTSTSTTTTTTTCITRPENLTISQLVTNVDYTDVTLLNSCTLFEAYQSSYTMDPISLLNGGAEYASLSVGQAIYLGAGETNCTRVSNGVYWIYPSVEPEGAQEYFYSLSTTAITIIVVTNGVISDIQYCFGGGSRTTTTTTTLVPPTYTPTFSLGLNAYTSQPFPSAETACPTLTLQASRYYLEGSDIVEVGTTVYKETSFGSGIYVPLPQAGWYIWTSDYIGGVDVPHTPKTAVLIDYTGTIVDIQEC